jgi:hypothetical protein
MRIESESVDGRLRKRIGQSRAAVVLQAIELLSRLPNKENAFIFATREGLDVDRCRIPVAKADALA